MQEEGIEFKYLVGTMIEVPRAALTSSEIAGGDKGAQFFSFGTNDLHQMALGFSRDDAGSFISKYMEMGILESDPFVSIEETGVGRLMKMTVDEGKAANPELELGICGEQGGDPQSIDFCYRIGLDYVSCSPFRVPIARLAAARTTLKN
ncbi:MAG: pyruvate, phosphate dikinase, partial [Candidatus Heimdallarchaeota archaeon]|nr:pyruvate, phosphate dikinase [Candidatus Heimdallarchaeota archaeon]MCK5144611.1 pyruvate, phosphate dikinase [Candidatus Heimdallarchaeota archaeon]